MLNHWIERAVAVVGRTLQINARVRLSGHHFVQRFYRARFADPGFAKHGDDLALSFAGHPPAIEHQLHFLGAADEGQVAAVGRGGPTFGRRFAEDPPNRHRAGESFNSRLPIGSSSNNPPSRFRVALLMRIVLGDASACSRAAIPGRVAHDGALLRGARADDLADYDKASGDADPRLDGLAVRAQDPADVGQGCRWRRVWRVLQSPRRRAESRSKPKRRHP